MADCYKALLAEELSCVSTSIAIIHLVTPVNEFKNIIALHKKISTVAMLTRDASLCHFTKRMYHGGITRLHILISYVLLV